MDGTKKVRTLSLKARSLYGQDRGDAAPRGSAARAEASQCHEQAARRMLEHRAGDAASALDAGDAWCHELISCFVGQGKLARWQPIVWVR